MANISTRGRAFPRASPPSSASVGSDRNGMYNARIDSQLDSSALAVPIMFFRNLLRIVQNNYQPSQAIMPVNVPN